MCCIFHAVFSSVYNVVVLSCIFNLPAPKYKALARSLCVLGLIKVLRLTRHRIDHFGVVLLSQSLGLLLKKLNLTQQKQETSKMIYANTKNM